MLNKAVELADTHGWFLCRQFENEANAEVHTRTTAREILDDFADEPLHYFVTGFGTGGTLLGVSRAFRKATPATRIVVGEPDNSPVLGSGIPQSRGADGAPCGSHPSFRPHLMQGWGPDFISRLTEEAVSKKLVDEILPVAGDDAMRLARELARQEGIFVGTSSGATLAAALQVARRSAAGTNIVCMLPDTGERYLSTPLFEDISEEMTVDELALSRSTPSCRFDAPAAVAGEPAARQQPAELDPDALRFVDATIANEPVVLFALEWCEFCWSVRKLFNHYGIPCHSVDLDSVACQQDNLGGRIREVLARRTGARTIPQLYIGGHHIGGCTELFDAWREGSAQQRLRAAGVEVGATNELDPYSLLPTWLQPRQTA
jgi:cysteine synthase A